MHYWKPQYIENLQAQIEFVEKMAPMIAQTRSITAQNTYIYKLADLLPDFDYLQIEQIVNNSRLHQRQEAQSGGRSKTSNFSVELLPNRGMTRLIKAENHLLSRMKDFPMVLNDYRLRPDFAFEHRSYRSCINCSVKMEKSPLRIYPSSLKGSSTPGTAC